MEQVATILSMIRDSPLAATAVATALAAVATFARPIMASLQAALIRRIDQAWPDDLDMEPEDKVRCTVDAVNPRSVLPRGVIEATVRKHKSVPPQK